jgi:hypothetical protein
MTAGAGAWLEVDRFRSRPDGRSEFVRARIPAGSTVPLGDAGDVHLSAAFASPNVKLLLMPGGLDQPVHPAPEPQIVVVLRGRIEVTTGDGVCRSWGPGEFFIASDHDGIGHSTRTIDGPTMLMFVPLGDADLEAWTVASSDRAA